MSQRSFRMELIKKESTRKHTFEKRKASLVKKVSEISILCGVEVGLIIYAPKKEDEHAKLDTVWPSDSQVRKVIEKYKTTNKAKRSYTVSDYFAEKKRKVDSEMSKLKKQTNGVKYPCWDIRLENLSIDELLALNCRLDRRIEVAGQRLSLCKGSHKDLMLHLSEKFGDYMNRKSNFPVLSQLQNKLELPLPMPMPPVGFRTGQSWFTNPPNLNTNSQQQQPQPQQMLLSDSNSMVLNRGKAIDRGQFEEGNRWGISKGPIWQGQKYVNSLGWKLNCNNDSYVGANSLQYMRPQMVAPISSMPYQLPQGKFFSGSGFMDLTSLSSSSQCNGLAKNHLNGEFK